MFDLQEGVKENDKKIESSEKQIIGLGIKLEQALKNQEEIKQLLRKR